MDGLERMFIDDDGLEAVVSLVKERKEELIAQKKAKMAKSSKKKKNMVIEEPIIVKKKIGADNEQVTKLNWYAFAISLFGSKQVLQNKAVLYRHGDENSKQLKTLKSGTTVSILSEHGKWTKVEVEDDETTYYGWLLSDSIVDDAISCDDALHMIGIERKNIKKEVLAEV